MIPCSKCSNNMPKLRKEKAGFSYCVNCSTAGPYQAIQRTGGTGDHTWNDIEIVTPEQYNQYLEQENNNTKLKRELLNLDGDNDVPKRVVKNSLSREDYGNYRTSN